jgi:hypothetical protein
MNNPGVPNATCGPHFGPNDPARADRDEAQADSKAKPRVIQSEGQVPTAVNDRKGYDRAVLPEKGVGDNRAEQRKKVSGSEKEVGELGGLGFGHVIGQPVGSDQIFCHEHEQDRPHAVITESLRRLIPHDVRHGRGHFRRLERRRQVLRRRHGPVAAALQFV